MIKRVRAALISPQFARLVAGRAFSSFGSILAYTALAVYVYQRTGSAKAVGLTELIMALPVFLFGVPGGAFADRHDRRMVMAGSVAIQAAAWVGLALRPGLVILCLLLAVSSAAGVLYGPAMTASIPHLVPKSRLLHANSLTETVLQATTVLGPAAGGAGVALFGFPAICIFNAFTFLVAGLVILTLPIPKIEPAVYESGIRGYGRSIREGFHALGSDRALAGLYAGLGMIVFGGSAMVVLLVVFVTQVLHASATRFGAIMSLIAIGSVAGAFLPPLVQRRLSRSQLLRINLLAVGATLLAIAFSRSFVLFGALMVTVGLVQTSMNVVVDTWVMEAVPNLLLARFAAALGIIMTGSRMAALAAGAALADVIGVCAVYQGGGALAAAGAVLAAVLVGANSGTAAPAATGSGLAAAPEAVGIAADAFEEMT